MPGPKYIRAALNANLAGLIGSLNRLLWGARLSYSGAVARQAAVELW